VVESTSPSEAEPIAAVEHLEVEGVVEQAAVVERGAPSSRPRLVKTSTMSSTLTSRLAKKCENLSSSNQISKLMKNPKISIGHPFVQISPSDSFQLHRRTFQNFFSRTVFYCQLLHCPAPFYLPTLSPASIMKIRISTKTSNPRRI
jgi:hypothetical protein